MFRGVHDPGRLALPDLSMKPSRTSDRSSSRRPGTTVIAHAVLKQLAAQSVFEFAMLLSDGGAITFANDRVLRATGYTNTALRGRTWPVVLKKKDGKSFSSALLKPGSASNPRKKSFSLVTSDGRLIPCTGKIFYFGGTAGSPVQALVMGSRVKRKSIAAADLSTDHRLLQSLVSTLPDGFAITDGAGVVLAVNPSLAVLTDRPADELVGSAPPYAWAGWAGNQRVGEALSEAKKTGMPAHRLIVVDRPALPTAAFSYWISPLRGPFAGLDLFLSSLRDISELHPVTDTRMSEKRIDRLKQQVHRSAVRLKTLQDINTSVLKSGSLTRIFRQITDGISRLVDHDLAGIYVFESDEKILKPHTLSKLTPFSRRLGKLPLPFGEGIIGTAAVAGKTVLVNDAQRDPRSKYPPGMKPETEHIIASPLRGRGSVYGILVVARNRDPGFHEEDALIVESFADAANVAIENTKLYMELGLPGQPRRHNGKKRRPVAQAPPPSGAGREFKMSLDREEIDPGL